MAMRPTVGISIAGISTLPPAPVIAAILASTLSTAMYPTQAGRAPCSAISGVIAINPPMLPSEAVMMR